MELKDYVIQLLGSPTDVHKGIYLHFGTFDNKQKAIALKNKLDKNKIDTFIKSDNLLHSVLSGPYPSQKEAELEVSTKAKNFLWEIISE